jgi:hypothetical protein
MKRADMAEPMSTPEKTALWAVLFGLGVAVVSLALPSAFDLPPYLWRVAFCLGVIVATISAFFIVYENFAKSHPNAKSKRTRVAAFLIFGIASVVGAVLISIVLPQPHPATINQEDLKAALFQPPHVVITQAQPTFLSKDDGIRFIVYFINVGPRAIRGDTIHFGLGFTLGGTVSKEDQEKALVGLSQFPMDRNSTDFMEAGITRNSMIPGDLNDKTSITIEKLKEIQQKKGTMFLAVQISFFDDKTNDIWRAELCEFWDYNVPEELVNNIAPHLCDGHNGMVSPKKGGDIP